MTYSEAIDYLYSLRVFGLKLGLENTRRLAAEAGHPQERLRFIHIAGTNGKGSVAAMLESIYRAAGLRVGLYTSPHLVSFRERIQVNRQMISEADVVRLAGELRMLSPANSLANPQSAIRSPHSHDACPTFFEFVTVMALRYFAEQKCDLVIWETGLGGRLDATNIVTPLASVITNIEPDHQRWLGHDLRSIAAEKAGIIKPGVPVITATSEPEAFAVIQDTARAQGSPLTLVTPSHGTHPPLDQIRLPLLGWHQRINAATALAAVQVLQPRLPVSESAVLIGLETVQWAGRLQLLARGAGRVLLDGAHNASGATTLRAAMQEEFAGQPVSL
ncbi:MAG: bifunctional folylpolyglutamate synthase/dihydrofolate synthase, partial [Verrucomicrobia bacterium]|nr:bifunctional folylpolyglutamate synthase/dihydrofolate synthase [Verrucomicrobiota bacterium]